MMGATITAASARDRALPPAPTGRTSAAAPLDNAEVMRLLAQIAQGDECAFKTLYRAFSRRLYAYVLKQLGDPAQAEEIVADTLYEVWRTPARFRGESQFSTWLIGVARNKLLMVWRARRPDARHEDIDDFAELIAADDHGGFDELADRQRRDGVLHCVQRLSAEHRECIHLVFYEGMALADVAQLQACPENTVKTRLFHARKKLEHCLRVMLSREGHATLCEGLSS
jgi:RNA polymerase sigma-70 factor (ECF subfamily)